MNRVLSALVLGGSAGAGIRGIMGLRNLMRKRPRPDEQSSIPVSVPVHLPQTQNPIKQANTWGWGREDGGVGALEWPAGVAAGAGGLYGGWKLVDWLLNKRRKSQLGSSLDAARKEYQQALQDQYSAAMMSKGASEKEPTIDDLFNHLHDREKCASHLEKLGFTEGLKRTGNDLLHGGTGMYLTALLALTGGAGLGAYNWTKSRSKAKALEDAIRKRRQMRAAPQPFEAVPQYDM